MKKIENYQDTFKKKCIEMKKNGCFSDYDSLMLKVMIEKIQELIDYINQLEE